MPKKWRTIRVRQELAAAAKRTLETGRRQSLSEFVSEAIRLRLQKLARARIKKCSELVEFLGGEQICINKLLNKKKCPRDRKMCCIFCNFFEVCSDKCLVAEKPLEYYASAEVLETSHEVLE